MRVTQTQRPTLQQTARAGRTRGGGGFRLADAGSSREAAELSGSGSVTSVETVIALQAVPENPGERRRRAVERGGRLLDLLDELKIGLLSGGVADSHITKLRKTIERDPGFEGDPRLNDVLKQIDLRARVELAKLKKTAA